MAWVDTNDYPPLTSDWADVQEKVFTRWLNTHLRRREPPIALKMGSLYRGALCSGVILWELIDQIAEDKPSQKVDRKGKMKIHHINNINISIDFLTKGHLPDRKPLKFVNIGSEDIYEMKKKPTAGFIWTIILRFQVADCSIDHFIVWLNSIGIMVKNLTSDWTDGTQLTKLLNIVRPGYMEPESNALQTIEKGLLLGEDELGIPQVIDAEDMAIHVEERSNFVYLSYYKQLWDELTGPSVRLVGDPRKTLPARKPCTIELKTWDLENPLQQITASFTAQDGELIPIKLEKVDKPECADGRTGFCQFTLVPPRAGSYVSNIKALGKDMRKGPLIINATPAPWAKLKSVPQGKQGIPSTFQVETLNGLTTDDLFVELDDSAKSTKVPALFSEDREDRQRFNCIYVPPVSGDLLLRVYYKDDGLEIEGSGASLRIFGKPSVNWSSDDVSDRFLVGVTSSILLRADGHTTDSLDVTVKDIDGNDLRVVLDDQGDGKFVIQFTPETEGIHHFDIKADLVSVEGLPRDINVEAKPTAFFTGPLELKGVAMKPVIFNLSTINLKPKEVKLNIKDANGNALDLPVTIDDNGDGTFSVQFTPTKVGPISVQVDAFNEDIGTLSVDVVAPPVIVGGSGSEHRRNARATKLFEFKLQASNITAEEIKVDIKDEKGEQLPAPTVKETAAGEFVVSFVPAEPGALTVKVWPSYTDTEPLFVDVAPIAKFIGDVNQVATATKPFSFKVQGAEGITVADIEAVVKYDDGQDSPKTTVTDNKDGTFTIEFTPMEPGRAQVFVSTCGDVFDTPLNVKVKPCASLIEGDSSNRKAAAARPFSFDLKGQKGLKAKNITVNIDSEKGSKIETPVVKENPDGSFTVTFVPPKPDQLKVNVLTHGVAATAINVEVVPTCHLDSSIKSLSGHVTKPVEFALKADAGLKPSDVHVDVKDKDGNHVPFTVTDNGNGTFKAAFVPVHHGDHTVVVSANGLPISDPLIADIQPLAQFKEGFTSSKHKAIATKPFSFDLSANGVNEKDIKIDIVNEKGEHLPAPVLKKNGEGNFIATFVPMEHGNLKVEVSTRGVAFDKKLDIEVAPIARFVGDSKRSTTATKLFEFQLDAPGLTPEDVVVDIEGKVGGVLPHPRVTDNGNGTFKVSFTPMAHDQLAINVTTKGEKFDTPLEVNVDPIASIIGGTKRIGTATKPVEFSLSAKDGLKPQDVSIDIVDENGAKLPPPTITDAGNGTFLVTFTPMEPGDLKVHVSTKGVLYDTPLEVVVRPTAKFIGGGRRHATATKPFDFSLGADQLKIEDVAVSITDENGNKLPPPSITDNKDGTFNVSFTPMEHGLLSVLVSTHGEAIGTPMEVEVAPIARFVGDLERVGHSTKPFEFTLDAPSLTPEDVAVSITNEKGYSLPPPTITDNGNGSFVVSFVPMDPCQLTINVSTKGELFDNPMKVNVLPTAKWKTPSVLPARATMPVNLKLQAEAGLTTSDIAVDIKYENGEKVEYEVKDNDDGTFTLSFIPQEEGEISVGVTAHGDPIGDAARVIVAPAPYAKLPPGPPLREATQTKPFTFSLDTVSLFPNEVKVMLGDEEVNIKVDDLRDGTFNITFVPLKVGEFPVKVMFHGKQVEGDPFSITVDPKPDVVGFSKLEGARVAKPFEIVLNTVNIKTSEVEVKLSDSEGKPITNFKLKEKGDDKMVITFIPKIPGEHTFDLVADSHEVEGLPTKFPVAPKPHATLVGDKKRKGVEGKLFEFKLNTVNLKIEDIRIEITDEKGDKIWREDALASSLDKKNSASRAPVIRATSSRKNQRSKSSKGDKGKHVEEGKVGESESIDQLAVAINTPALKGIQVPGDIVIPPPDVSKKGDEFKIGFVPWQPGKFNVKVTFEDVAVDLQVIAEPKPKTKTVETLDQLGLNAGFKNIGDEKELLKRIKELREELIKGYTRNNQLQEKHKDIEKTISLLVRNHTSIVAIDRARKKRQQGTTAATTDSTQTTFHRNRGKMVLYGNLFYLLRTEPQYLARLINLVDQKYRKDMSQLIILTLFTNAFSPTQELMLLRLISTAVTYDINSSGSLQDFVDNSPSIDLIIFYNKRKEGRRFIKGILTKPIQSLLDEDGFTNDIDKLGTWVATFYDIIVGAIDQLPYGIRYICQVIYQGLQAKFPKMEQIGLLSAVGYVVFYRFLNLCFIGAEDWGLIEANEVDAAHPFKLNCLSISKVLKSLFTDLKEISDPSLKELNPWIKSKLPEVQVFLKDVVDVSEPEEHLKVSKYSKLGDVDESILIPLKEIVFLHGECEHHKNELVEATEPTKDPLYTILEELKDVPSDGTGDKTQVSLPLQNKFEIQMSVVEREFNTKLETINELLSIFMDYPNVNGETLLEIFLIIKHKAENEKPKPADVKKVDFVLNNLETLAKVSGSALKKSNGYNDFIDDIKQELIAKEKHINELRGEIKQLSEANEELDQQKKKITEAIKAFEDYLQGVSNELRKNFKPTTRKFTWKQLTNKKCNIISSSSLPESQKKAVKFEITHSGPEEFKVKGKVAMVSKDFNIKMIDLLDAKDRGETTYDTETGVVLDVPMTLLFLNAKFLNHKRKYAKAK